MFYDGFPDKGNCAAGGGHNAAGYNFDLPYDIIPPETQHLRSIGGTVRNVMLYSTTAFLIKVAAWLVTGTMLLGLTSLFPTTTLPKP